MVGQILVRPKDPRIRDAIGLFSAGTAIAAKFLFSRRTFDDKPSNHVP